MKSKGFGNKSSRACEFKSKNTGTRGTVIEDLID